ncbi:hypothetical protein OK016_26885 [Vibrio chagasii]|nr:hypothetical protein [Vibrio chagasii]
MSWWNLLDSGRANIRCQLGFCSGGVPTDSHTTQSPISACNYDQDQYMGQYLTMLSLPR